jgi:hypothetical protein
MRSSEKVKGDKRVHFGLLKRKHTGNTKKKSIRAVINGDLLYYTHKCFIFRLEEWQTQRCVYSMAPQPSQINTSISFTI